MDLFTFLIALLPIIVLTKGPTVWQDIDDEIPTCNLAGAENEHFTKYGEKYYLFETTERLNWYAAQHKCRRFGGDLATITSENEMKAITAHLRVIKPNDWLWIGGNDLAKRGTWKWVGTGEEFAYTLWHPGQPDNTNNIERCVNLWQVEPLWTWNDLNCSSPRYYLCEKITPKTITMTIW